MHFLKELIKRLLPAWVLSAYHKILARLAARVYGHPSREMIVIGVTGTKGKSTTALVLWQLLTGVGYTVGLTSTVYTRIGAEIDDEATAKMTMAGRFTLQKLLRRMVRAGCDIAIVETSSQGIAQYRHLGVEYDLCVFTNLTPEHLEAHGGFEQYKQAKLELFRHLNRLPEKVLPSGERAVKRSIVNMDAEYGREFVAIGEYEKVCVGSDAENDFVIGRVKEAIDGTELVLNDVRFHLPLLGGWNASNVALALAATQKVSGKSLESLRGVVSRIEQIPGRMEFLREGQPFTVIVDYAYEPESLELLFSFCRKLLPEGARLLTTISSTGGGRDVGRRKPNGEVAGRLCDFVVITDEDPYDDDPMEIMKMVEEGVVAAGKIEGENYWLVPDRREAIAKLFALAGSGDVVLLVAKGAETKMAVAGGKKIDWDDREVARELLKQMKV